MSNFKNFYTVGGPGIVINGSITTNVPNVPMSINCAVNGDIYSCSDIVINSAARVTGNVTLDKGASLTVRGYVKGDITCSEKVYIEEEAEVYGDINYAKLAVDEGATCQGNFTHSEDETSEEV